MATYFARRANKVVRIGEDLLEKYIAQGYSITDADGNVIKKGTPTSTNQLTAEYKKQEAEILHFEIRQKYRGSDGNPDMRTQRDREKHTWENAGRTAGI